MFGNILVPGVSVAPHKQTHAKPTAIVGSRIDQAALSLPSPTFDAMRSFIVLAETQNPSETVCSLGLTRQTIRRHINLLEDIRKVQLFTQQGGAYNLTDHVKARGSGAHGLHSAHQRH